MPSSVAVVIPSIGRPELRRAVRSALAQTLSPDRVIVSWDLSEDDPRIAQHAGWLNEAGVTQVCTGGGRGASAARTRGVAAAGTDLIALLDDDDAWAPRKLAVQVALHDRLARTIPFPVVTSLVTVHDPSGNLVRRHPPTSDPEPGQLGRALFRRRWSRRASTLVVTTPSLLIPSGLLAAEPFDEGLRLHEDWEWLLRIDRRDDTRLAVAQDHLTQVFVGHPGPRASQVSDGWRTSVQWADSVALPRGVLGDFLLCDVLPRAMQHAPARDWRALIWRALRQGSPSPGALRETAGRLARTAVGITA